MYIQSPAPPTAAQQDTAEQTPATSAHHQQQQQQHGDGDGDEDAEETAGDQ